MGTYSFIEQLINRKFNLSEEVLTIEKLLTDANSYYSSLYGLIDTKFKKWKHRNNLISLDDLFYRLKLDDIVTAAENQLVNIDSYIYYVEYIWNILTIVNSSELDDEQLENKTVIIENIKNTIQQLNYKVKYFESEDYFKIILNDWKINESSEIVKDKYDLGEKILLYNHSSLKGKLFDKADILCRLYKVFEDERESILKANQYKSLASDISFLSDKLDVRHAPNKEQKILLEGFTKEEQEDWYDCLFDIYLDMLILCDHINKRKDIKLLSQKLALIIQNK